MNLRPFRIPVKQRIARAVRYTGLLAVAASAAVFTFDVPAQAESGAIDPVLGNPVEGSPVEGTPVDLVAEGLVPAEGDEPWQEAGTSVQPFSMTAATGEAATGDWSATDLSNAGSWTQAGSSGGFVYSYEMRTPPAEGPVPAVGLSYSSQAVDGATSSTNNQAGLLGDGWGYHPGFIERSYTACRNDDGGNTPDLTGDWCWDGDSDAITLSLNGVNDTLVKDDDTGTWYVAADSGWKVELLGSKATASVATSEYWKITDADGTQYFFAGRTDQTDSRLTAPVFGNHSGEACYVADDFEGSSCRQAYRWLLDKTVDIHGNVAHYNWKAETGYYGAAAEDDNRQAFHRASYPTSIEYGLRDDATIEATAKVIFDYADRCTDDCRDSSDEPKTDNWPDTPWDLNCETAPCADDQRSMAFFTAKRLTTITTYVNSATGFTKVDSWALTQEFKDYGDAEDTTMWLASVQHTGHVDGTASTPPVTFEGTAMANRVEHSEGTPAMWRMRLTVITSETGAVTGIWYSPEDCDWDDLPDKQDNDQRCYPTLIDQGDEDPMEEWFHKYAVTQVAEFDTTAGQVPVRTYYDYETTGGGTDRLWAWDDSEFTDDELRTYNQWRGYPQVTTTTGDAAEDTQLTSRTRYYRGMNGQPDTATGTGTRSVSVTDAEGDTVTDHEALAGFVFETAAFNGSAIIESTVDRYWTEQTAERDHDGGTQKAWLTGVTRSDSRRLLDTVSDTWQRTRVDTTFDDLGRAVAVSDLGDLADPDDQRCTRTEYTDNAAAHLYSLARRIDVVAVACDQTASRPGDIVSDTRFYYDDHTSMTDTPDQGLLTATRLVKEHDGTEATTVETMTAAYDDLGRLVSATDALGNTTTTAYTPTGAGPLESVTTTNPLGHTSTVDSNPAWGAPTKTVDPNDRVTEIAYDPFGRTTAAWGPGRSRTAHPDDPTAAYEYLVSNTEPSAVLSYGLTPTGQQRLESTVIYDSLLREVQAQAPTAAGGRLVTGIEYDTRSLATWESGPNWIEDTGPGTDLVAVAQGADHARTFYTYDDAGRIVLEEFMSHQEILWNTETIYGGSITGWMVAINPPEGATPTAEITNSQGELIEKRNYHGDTATGDYDEMVYDYNHRGRLATVTDPAGNEWSYEYDLRGNQTSATDPDTGTTTASWDDAGQLIQTTDARGQILTTTYDELGRKTNLYSGDVSTGERLSAWRYDQVSGGLGLPYLAAAYIGDEAVMSQVNAYDASGRPTRTTEWIPAAGGLDVLAGAYRVSQFYLPDGSVSHINLPQVSGLASENILFDYNDLSQVTRVQGSLGAELIDYVSDASYTAWGELAQRVHGSTTGKKVYQTFTYEDGTRRSAEYRLSRDATGTTNAAHLSYEYDQAGNILSIADAVTDSPGEPERQCFAYDYLQRLTEAWAQAGTGECVTEDDLDTADIGGPGAYWTSYEYDVTGNRTKAIGHGIDGSETTSIYAYSDTEAHLLESITTADQANTYAWDDAGNLTERVINGETESLEWNAQGKLAAITSDDGTTSMLYDAANSRIGRIDTDGSVNLFVAGHEITVDAQNVKHAIRTYSHNEEMIATRSTDAGLTWIGTTHQGTAAWAISATTMILTYRRQDPFGGTRGNDVDWMATQQGFHTGIEDPTGLTSMGARFYDPGMGRFISRDPIQVFTDSQQINGYAYANNDPANMSDPSGLLGKKSKSVSKTNGGLKGKKVKVSPNNKAGTAKKTSNKNTVKPRMLPRLKDGKSAAGSGSLKKPNLKPLPNNSNRWAQIDGTPIGPFNDCNCWEGDWLDDLLGGNLGGLWDRAEPYASDCIEGVWKDRAGIAGATVGGGIAGAGAGSLFAGVGTVAGAVTGALGGFGAAVGYACSKSAFG